jgi:hypothetical protein
MKATARMMKGGTGDQTRATLYTLEYLFCPIKNNPSCIDRVAWVGGDLDGYGVLDRKASLMAVAMDYGHEHLRGRRHRHIIVSCEACEEEDRADAERRLRQSAPLLATLHGARRWIAVIHRDTGCPHMHLILANFDELKLRRFNFWRAFLKKLQKMEWTPYLEMGKGHHTGISSPRGQAISQLRKLRKQEDPIKRNQALEQLHSFLTKNKALVSNMDAIVATLTSHDLPSGWDGAKLVTKTGKPKAKPSLVIDGVEIRLVYFQRYARGRSRDLRLKDKKSPRKNTPSSTEVDQRIYTVGPTL